MTSHAKNNRDLSLHQAHHEVDALIRLADQGDVSLYQLARIARQFVVRGSAEVDPRQMRHVALAMTIGLNITTACINQRALDQAGQSEGGQP